MACGKEEDRHYNAEHVFGAAISLKFVKQGLQRNVSLAAMKEALTTRLKMVCSRMDEIGRELLALAQDIRGQDDDDQGDTLRETKVGR